MFFSPILEAYLDCTLVYWDFQANLPDPEAPADYSGDGAASYQCLRCWNFVCINYFLHCHGNLHHGNNLRQEGSSWLMESCQSQQGRHGGGTQGRGGPSTSQIRRQGELAATVIGFLPPDLHYKGPTAFIWCPKLGAKLSKHEPLGDISDWKHHCQRVAGLNCWQDYKNS